MHRGKGLHKADQQAQSKGQAGAAVSDQVIAMDAFKELVGSCPAVKLIMNHMRKRFGSALTLEDLRDRIDVDSGTRLVERGDEGVKSAFVAEV